MIPGLGRNPGEWNGNPLQYSCLENSMAGGAWWATVHGVANSQTQLSDLHFTSPGEGMATHSSIIAWRIAIDRGAWWATVHGVAKSRAQLSDFTFTFIQENRKLDVFV